MRLDTFGVCKIPLTTYSIHIMDQENHNFNRLYRVNLKKKIDLNFTLTLMGKYNFF
jgi:hypothetical protein